MISLQIVTSFMYENFERVTVSEGGTHFHAKCRLCGDSKKSLSKKRFHLDWKNGKPVYHCWNCGKSGSFIKLYMIVMGVDFEQAKKDLFKYDSKRMKKQLQSEDKPAKTVGLPQVFDILDDCWDENICADATMWLTASNILKRFRSDRKIPEEYKLYMAYKGKYKGRIIIPVFSHEKVVYFQARRIPDSGWQPKYLNPSSEKEIIIHNKDKFDREKYIVVTEGLIDAFMVGEQGTTCLGKEISEDFLRELFKLTGRGVIVAFDNDDEGMKAMLKFMKKNRHAKKVRYFLTPKKYKECKDINKIVVRNKEVGSVYDMVNSHSYDYWKTYTTLKLGG